MSFIKRNVKDRVVQYPHRYQLVEVQPGIFDLIPVTGTVTEEGTPVNKELLQRYEDGISDLDAEVVAHKADDATDAHTPKNIGIDIQAAGDLIIGTGADTVGRLPKGENGQVLMLEEGLPTWGARAKIVSGTYRGDGTTGRQINVGFQPKLVFLTTLSRTGNATQSEILIYNSEGATINDVSKAAASVESRPQGFASIYTSQINESGVIVTTDGTLGMNINGFDYAYVILG